MNNPCKQKAIMILNSPEFNSDDFVDFFLSTNDDTFLTVVDGGINHYLELRKQFNNSSNIDLFIGDMDSVDKSKFNNSEVIINRTMTLNKDKDYSDFHFALLELVRSGFNEVTVFAGIGGRTDHFISVYESSILFSSKYDLNVSLIGENESIYFKNKSFNLLDILIANNLIIYNNQTVSLFSGTKEVTNLSLDTGFKYRTSNFDLKRDNPIGLSNFIIDRNNILISFDEFSFINNEAKFDKNVLVIILNK